MLMPTAIKHTQAYRLLNHGPTVLVSTAHDTQRNIMAAAWSMPLDFDPPKIAIVIDKNTYTRELIEVSGVNEVHARPTRKRSGSLFGRREIQFGSTVPVPERNELDPAAVVALTRELQLIRA